MGSRTELLKTVEIPQLQFSVMALTMSSRSSGARCLTRSVLDRARWVTFAWRLTLSTLRVSVRGLAYRTAEARGDSTGAVLGQGYAAHHLRVVSAIRVWLGNEYGFRRPSLEREVQLDVCVHSSSCGSLRDAVHSPLKGSTIVAAGVFASRRRVWWKFHS